MGFTDATGACQAFGRVGCACKALALNDGPIGDTNGRGENGRPGVGACGVRPKFSDAAAKTECRADEAAGVPMYDVPGAVIAGVLTNGDADGTAAGVRRGVGLLTL